jgi:threonine dehydratase
MIREARRLLKGVAHRTPLEPSRTFSHLAHCEVTLKCECLQRAGSYKVRGAYVRVARLLPRDRRRGVIAASAGNHAQGVALAARLAGVSATVVMPRHAPIAKVMATEEYGARVIQRGETYDEAEEAARALARRTGAGLIPAFDDAWVVAGQGTVGLEICEDYPECEAIVVPTGGGGLLAGVAVAAKGLRRSIQVFGVQAAGAAAFPPSLRQERPVRIAEVHTIADGIAVRRPGDLTFPLVRQLVDDVVTVEEGEIAATILLLLERAKLVVEGAGAVALAAILHRRLPLQGKKVVAILSGGNIDINLLSRILEKGLARAGRYLRMEVPLQDRPGALKELLAVVARAEGNIISISHDRLDPRMPVDRVEVALTVETRDRAHGQRLLGALRRAGYRVRTEGLD